ncbi:hypothetical protein VKT23_004359 [Stygiomarasmius scandens]|uniref:JmjC domain-containing protein n=1 Tax=Marasmiellus scandens TaxID=2682957 RepID=A0ABR1JWE5_9AGAR
MRRGLETTSRVRFCEKLFSPPRDETTRYFCALRRKDNENQDQWIERLQLHPVFGNNRLSQKDWDILGSGRQAVSNYYNNPKRRKSVSDRQTDPPSRKRRKNDQQLRENTFPSQRCIDLTTGVKGFSLPNEAAVIEWTGSSGTVLRTCAPTIRVDGANLLQEEEDYIKAVATQYGFVETSNEHVVFLDPEMPEILSVIRFHLAQNKLVFVTPGLSSYTHKDLSTKDLHESLLEHNVKEDRRIEAHSMKLKCSSTPGYEQTIPMTVKEFIRRVDDHDDSLSYRVAKVTVNSGYSGLDDLETAIANTDREIPDWEGKHLTDKSWGLVHHPGTFTSWHHDGDGKVTAIVPKLGVKLWSAYIPSRALAPVEVEKAILRLCGQKLVVPEAKEGIVITIMLKPGDLLFQPAGLVHQVYTPTISYFQGSSFWMYNSLHLTQFSRLIDAKYGDITTNVDHQELAILRSMVRLALFIPLATDIGNAVSASANSALLTGSTVHYKKPAVALYEMIANAPRYIAEHTLVEPSDTEDCRQVEAVEELRAGIVLEMRNVAHQAQAMKILEKLITKDFGLNLGKKKLEKCQAYLEKTDREWFMPGESGKVDFVGLRLI